jgi:pSer/pThr/pTyr-binding forkhead associated (FHA) protein
MQFRLRYGAHDVELPPGEFVIGRSEECQLALDDPMVSRRHVALRVSTAAVVAVDLGSRNGLTINGERLRNERQLVDGDRLRIGTHELCFQVSMPEPRQRRLSTRTLQAVDVRDIESTAVRDPGQPAPVAPQSKAAASLQTLAQLANKAFALGRVDEADRILSHPLGELQKEIKSGRIPTNQVLERAASYAVRLAIAGNNSTWIDWTVDVYADSERLMPSQLVEDLHGAVRKVKGARSENLTRYIEAMSSSQLSPADRFLLQRIEGLVQLLKA